MFITPSFKKSLIVEQFQVNYLKQLDMQRNVLPKFIEICIETPCWMSSSNMAAEIKLQTKAWIYLSRNSRTLK